MKAFFTAACLLIAASVMAQMGVATIAPPAGIGSNNGTGESADLGTTDFLSCSPSCKVSLPRIYISDETVNEWDGVVYVTVSIAPSSAQTVSVKYMTKNGSAKQPKDYEKVFGVLHFLPGEAFKKIAIPIVSDPVGEPEEEFFVDLSLPINATIEDESGRVTINDVVSRPGESLVVPFAAAATPNPSRSSFLVSVTGEDLSPIQIHVYDAVGRLVKTYTVQLGNYMRIGEDWKPGVYTVKVTRGGEVATLKVVKL